MARPPPNKFEGATLGFIEFEGATLAFINNAKLNNTVVMCVLCASFSEK